MNAQINQLVRSLLQKDDIGQCSLQELQQFADKNPYFGAAQLLLTKKMQTEAPAQYEEQLQKTFLFFNNPLWVEQVLNGTGKARVTPAEKKPEPLPVVVQTEGPSSVEIPQSLSPVAASSVPEPVAEVEVHDDVATATIPQEEPTLENPALAMEPVTDVAPAAKDELLFEPYHMVDYFASQGIKFKEEEKPQDKLGQQLKSFTDWLKSMKRLPVSEIAKSVENSTPAQAEKKVEQMAEHSLAEREVVTEAMAEVWEKQGNPAKAIEIYEKLSLLDPSKSAYFAAKISALNNQT